MKSRFAKVLVAVAIAVFFSGSKAATTSQASADLPAVEVGLPQDGLFGLGGQYILDKGLDRKHGFAMKPRWAGVPEIQRLLAIKAIPVGLMTPEAGLRARVRGASVTLIQPYQVPHMHVLVHKNSPYKEISDLKGKSIALTPELTGLYNLFDFMMRKKGYNIERDFQLKKLGAPGIIAVLEKEQVDAGIIWEAHVSRLLVTGKYRVIMTFRDELEKLLDTKQFPEIWLGGLDSWVKSNPGMVRNLRAAWTDAYRGVQRDEAHFRKYAKNFFGLETPEELKLAWKRTRVFLLPSDFTWPDATSLKALKSYLREGVKMGMFPEKAGGFIDGLFVP